MTVSEDFLSTLLHQSSKIASTCYLSLQLTKILALKRKELIRDKIIINNNIIEHTTNFNYLGYQWRSNRNYDIQNKLHGSNIYTDLTNLYKSLS
jgi:hypothetical protein